MNLPSSTAVSFEDIGSDAGPRDISHLRLAIIGSRGYPSTYGGFETLVRHLAPFLADQGHDVTVYARHKVGSKISHGDSRIRSVVTKGIDCKCLSTLSFGATSALHAGRQKYDAALVLNPANGYFLSHLRRAGIPTAVNVDGLEWQRAKWNSLGKRVFFEGAKRCGRYADEIVFDSEALRPHWTAAFGVSRGVFIPYGANLVDLVPTEPIERLGLRPSQYVLVVSRFVPENNLDLFMDAAALLDPKIPVVMVGSGHKSEPVARRIQEFAAVHDNVMLLGHVSDQTLLTALWKYAGAYWHGHSVGGTNPGLLQAMGAGAPTLALDTPFNAEVLTQTEQLVPPVAEILAARLATLLSTPAQRARFRQSQRQQIRQSYGWESVCRAYETLLSDLAQVSQRAELTEGLESQRRVS